MLRSLPLLLCLASCATDSAPPPEPESSPQQPPQPDPGPAPEPEARQEPEPELPPEPPPPNIVLVLADDLGWGDLGCYSESSRIATPHIDRLATEGMRFLDAHSPSAVCTPTRYGLLTGRYAWRTWLKQSVLLEWDPPLIEADRATLPGVLRSRGYTTACIGKWHLGWEWPTVAGATPESIGTRERFPAFVDWTKPIGGGPTTRGFDTYFGDDTPHFPPYCWIEDDEVVAAPTVAKPETMWGPPGPMVEGWTMEAILPTLTERAIAYLDERGAAEEREPFFLYFSLSAPHTPIAPDKPFVGSTEAGPYGDFVAQIDHVFGQVVEALERNGFARNTLLVFTSDNGSPARSGVIDMSGPTGSLTEEFGHHPNGPWRGIKSDIWEAGHRVPLIVRWPGRVEPGSVSEEIVCHTDFFATLAAIAGAAVPADAAPDSYDFLPVLEGAELEAPLREATVLHSIWGMFAIRQERWKLCLGLGSGGWTDPAFVEPQQDGPAGQLYDLAADPGEENNVFLQHPEVVERLVKLFLEYHESGRSVPARIEGSLHR